MNFTYLADAVQQNKRWANSLNLQLIPAWTRLSSALLKADLISPDEFRRRKDAGVEYAKELVRHFKPFLAKWIASPEAFLKIAWQSCSNELQVQCFSSYGERTSRGDP